MDKIKKTFLNDWHRSRKANMAEFGGYEMPLWYKTGAKEEHLAVLTRAGLFDTSHMAGVLISGPDSFDLLQLLFTKDLNRCIGKDKTRIESGRSTYGAFLNEKGHVVDDSIILQLDEKTFLPFVNAGMGNIISSHISGYRENRNVKITDLTGMIGKIDLQGPFSAKIIGMILADPEKVLKDLIYFKFKGHYDPAANPVEPVHLKDNSAILLSRTGYTGEFGFEIFMTPDRLESTWNLLLDAGERFGLIPCGLASRDSLRAGAVLPLSHQDIGDWPYINHPWPFALPYSDNVKEFTKTFIGADALQSVRNPEYTYPFIGYDLRKVSGGKKAKVVKGGKEIGTVLTCVTDMGIGRQEEKVWSIASPDRPKNFTPGGLCCGFVKVEMPLEYGCGIELLEGRRKIKVRITEDIRPDRTARKSMKKML